MVGVLALGIISEVEGLELKLFIMSCLEPDNQRVVISLTHQMLIGPFIIS